MLTTPTSPPNGNQPPSIDEAREAVFSGQFQRAIELLEPVQDRLDAPGLELLGWALLEDGEPELALKSLEAAANRAPNQATIWFLVGRAAAACGALADARLAFETSLLLTDEPEVVWQTLGEVEYTFGHVDRAIRAWRAALRHDPAPLTHACLARALAATDPQTSYDHARASLQLGREDALVREHVGWGLLDLGDPEQARFQFERAGDGPTARAGLAQSLMALGRREEAWDVLGEPEASPLHALAYAELATERGQARHALHALVTASPHAARRLRPALRHGMARAHEAIGDLATAHRHYTMAHNAAGLRHLAHANDQLFHHLASTPAPRTWTPPSGPRPCFVVGLPGSGAAELSGALARLPTLRTAPPDLIPGLIATASREVGKGWPESVAMVHGELALHARAAWQARMHGTRSVLHPNLDPRQLSFVSRVFPDARVIWVRRDPSELAVDLYRRAPTAEVPWAGHAASLRQILDGTHALLELWKAQLGLEVRTVDYADLCDRPADVLGDAAVWCEVDEDEDESPWWPTPIRVEVDDWLDRLGLRGLRDAPHWNS